MVRVLYLVRRWDSSFTSATNSCLALDKYPGFSFLIYKMITHKHR